MCEEKSSLPLLLHPFSLIVEAMVKASPVKFTTMGSYSRRKIVAQVSPHGPPQDISPSPGIFPSTRINPCYDSHLLISLVLDTPIANHVSNNSLPSSFRAFSTFFLFIFIPCSVSQTFS